MKNRVAVIDLGTNTFHLLIAETASRTTIIYQETIAVKLGEGGINAGIITDAAFLRGIEALKKFSNQIKKYQPEEIRTAGTAALRSASNGEDFIKTVYQETGIKISIIEGDTEARLIYQGVKYAVNMKHEPLLIMDIGGGSVEFILCNCDEIFWKESYPLGAAKLMEKFHHHDPISEEEVNAIYQHLDAQLSTLKQACLHYQPSTLIGSAGAFETFAALVVSRFGLQHDLLNQTEFTFNLSHFKEISNELLLSTHAWRASNPGIVPVRVDMIVVSSVITNYILETFNIPGLKLSAYALKEGMLFG